MKTKVDLLIVGNLLSSNELAGGGGILRCPQNLLNQYYDITESIIIHGDVSVESFNSKEKVVVATDSIATKGGSYGKF